MSNSEHASRADGCCRLWPDVNTHFLSLKGLPPDAVPRTAAQQVLHPLLVGFDAIAGCELKEFYRFKMHLQRLPEAPVACPELLQVVAAFRCWVDFDYSGARALFIAHLHEYPGDVLTVFFVHMLDFCTGKTCDLVDVFEICDSSVDATHPLSSFYLGIKSFVLCERVEFEQARVLGLQAVAQRPDNIYAIHGVVHALHEQQQWAALCEFLEGCKDNWAFNPGMRMHIYWHLAIAYLMSSQYELSTATFREFYALKDFRYAKQDLDAVGFLWRLKLQNLEDRQFDELWQDLSILWSGSIGTSTSHFHNMHAAFAFAAADRPLLIDKLIAESDGFGIEPATQQVGVDVLNAIAFFARGAYAECYQILAASQSVWLRLGGSRAQRELLMKTMNMAQKMMPSHQPRVRLVNAL